jgi:hypothetical protein
MIGTVRIITVTFLEDEVYDGGIPQASYDNATTADFEVDTVEEAARVISNAGLTFAATNNEWAAYPDGSQIVDYATGRREEVTAHLDDFTDADIDAIIEAVG